MHQNLLFVNWQLSLYVEHRTFIVTENLNVIHKKRFSISYEEVIIELYSLMGMNQTKNRRSVRLLRDFPSVSYP